MESVLLESESLLLDEGFSGFSIPTLARRLGSTRASIYKFFPTPVSLLNELAERHLTALETHLEIHAWRLRQVRDWQELVSQLVHAAADFYRKNPAAQAVLLVGTLTHGGFRALELSIAKLGTVTRNLLADRGVALPVDTPNVAALAVEFGTACFRVSVHLHGRITPEYTRAAQDVMLTFLGKKIEECRLARVS